jgi:hypothetical protein
MQHRSGSERRFLSGRPHPASRVPRPPGGHPSFFAEVIEERSGRREPTDSRADLKKIREAISIGVGAFGHVYKNFTEKFKFAWTDIDADTNPNDAGSSFRASRSAITGSSFEVTVPTSAAREYHLELISDLGSGSWTQITNRIQGNGGPLTLTHDLANAPRGFYRVVVSMPDEP